MNYILPLALVVASNVMYQICAKAVPGGINPLASLTVTYAVGTVLSLVLFFLLNMDANLFAEYRKLNWAPFLLGVSIVGLEVGFILAYKAGWQMSILQVVQGILLAMILLVVGFIFFKEGITWNKIVGVVVCLAGLTLINFR
ncbi:MAG: EamA family transporter [Treponema sp.]|nr:EamA family transporter [Treponema sp.]